MPESRRFHVYIMTNGPRSHVLYTGVTGNLSRRVFEHKTNSCLASPAATTSPAWLITNASSSPTPGSIARRNSKDPRQTFEITNEAVTGHLVALEVHWDRHPRHPFGTLAAGRQMRCHTAISLEFRDGKIVAQRNYDRFDPW